MKEEKNFQQSRELFEELRRVYAEIEKEPLPVFKKYKSGDCIYKEGQFPKGIYYIKRGTVKLTHHTQKKQITVRYATQHDLFGYLSLIKHWDYVTTATAIEDSEIYFVPRQIFFKVIHSDNRFTSILVDTLCNRITNEGEILLHMLTKEVSQRLALLLLSFNHSKLNEHSHIDGIINIPKKELAAILNVSPETISRNLLYLAKEKAIKLYSRTSKIEIISKQKLVHLSELND